MATIPLILLASLFNLLPAYADAYPQGFSPTPAYEESSRSYDPPLWGSDAPPSPRGVLLTDWRGAPEGPTPPTLLEKWNGAPEGFNPPGIDGFGNGNNNGNNQQNGGNGNGNNGCGNGNGGPNGDKECGGNSPTPSAPSTPGVPAPLPIIGATAAFLYSRKLRRRIAE